MDFLADCGILDDRSDWCRGGVAEGMDKASVDKCFGPPDSICDYSCLPGYTRALPGKIGIYPTDVFEPHTCHEGDHVFSGGHCEPNPPH